MRNETILLAEDEEILRGLAQDVLEGLGYRILLAKDGAEAVETFVAHGHQIDGVLLDVVMPRLNGYSAYECIRSLNRDVPVIFMTGYSAEMLRTKFLQPNLLSDEPEAVIIEKPYTIETLGHKLREALDSACSTR
ncbi:MAG TPA: response regulator [Pyrinomonadaceae bacterium]|nr:response regulator [Pyrinomonadaceae bacterium]